jgi:transcriptional regulator with XRE-family HTH domain
VIFVDNAKTVETIRALCKKKKTSLTRLEEKLGFSNGYIGKMAKRPNSPPYDKLVAIANELGVTVADLTGDSENEKKPTAQGEGRRERLSKLSYEDLLLLQEDVIAELRERGQK